MDLFRRCLLQQGTSAYPDLRSAFATARTLISLREMHNGFVPSNPQIAGGKNIDILLAERRGAATTGQQH
jgi:hypothetical protein